MLSYIFSFLSLLLLLPLSGFAQEESEVVRVHIYSAAKTHLDPQASDEAQKFSRKMKKEFTEMSDDLRRNPSRDLKDTLGLNALVGLGTKADMFTIIPPAMTLVLRYTFVDLGRDVEPNFSSDSGANDIAGLIKDATDHKLQYILRFPDLAAGRVNDSQYYYNVHFQIFATSKSKLILDTTFYGIGMRQEDGATKTIFEEATSEAMEPLVKLLKKKIAENENITLDQEVLEHQRDSVLLILYHQPFDASVVNEALPPGDPRLQGCKVYQCLYNKDKTKFTAFFSDPHHPQDGFDREMYKTLKEQGDESLADTSTYIFCLGYKGLLYQNKWYVQSIYNQWTTDSTLDEMQYHFFNETLKWSYLKERTPVLNPNYWQMDAFDTVRDYYSSIRGIDTLTAAMRYEMDEVKPFIGMPMLVVSELQQHISDSIFRLDSTLKESVLIPYYQTIVARDKKKFDYPENAYDDLMLLYPADRHVVINPIMFRYKKSRFTVKFYVAFPNTKDVYEWTAIKPLVSKKLYWDYNNALRDALNKYTSWDFSMKFIRDQHFWDEFVTKQKDGKYVYLKKAN